jgi:RES domain-containing protein
VSLGSLVAALDELEPIAFRADVFRHVAVGRDPRSGRAARIHGGRRNPPDSFSVVYCGQDVETVVDEFHRLARRQRVPMEGFLPRELYRLRVVLSGVLDLRGEAARETLGLDEHALRRDRPAACQEVGAAAHSIGVEAILAPSAANGGTVLAVFLDALRPDSSLDVVGLEELWALPPAPPPRA